MVANFQTVKTGKYTGIVKPFFEKGWWDKLEEFVDSSRFDRIIDYLKSQKAEGKTVVPRDIDCFNAFKHCPYDKLKVVIIGQDPYPGIVNGKPEANGLAFGYSPRNDEDVYIPQSLKVILREIEKDIYKNDNDASLLYNTSLINWAKQGVLLLNTALTTQMHYPGMHTAIWKEFIYNVINIINNNNPGTIFMLWGEEAKALKPLLFKTHHVLETYHPAAEFYSRGKVSFVGCGHFSEANKILEQNNGKEARIIW